ncbi:T9SS type A sorting domain-containing protein [Chitinispirillales bacterium ANBcel5]|uniref:T9SS type A sorting domain-containing protein n=1 Tax=Cellulosispirillum alkaliphilum TaxID=3039283 RepID=UPI002A4E70B9|nr:T9SS type A sorting domain-containing protein [Chitinispirillales bacterium ANBcel5]
MGKKIIRASRWSWHSAVLLYAKAVTLFFAFFCVVSGQGPKAFGNESLSDGKNFRGRALRASDSTAITNTRLIFSQTYIVMPEYGILPPPYYEPIPPGDARPLYGVIDPGREQYEPPYQGDTFEKGTGTLSESVEEQSLSHNTDNSVTSDHKGNFEINRDLRYSLVTIIAGMVDSVSGDTVDYTTSPQVIYEVNTDSVYSFYFSPVHTTRADYKPAKRAIKELHTVQGQTVTLDMSGWSSTEAPRVSVIDMQGKVIERLGASNGKVISWNTSNTPAGVYFIRLSNHHTSRGIRVVVK